VTVGIFDADSPTALAFTRSLGRAGVPLRVYSPRRLPVARFSRYCTDFARCPPEDGESFAPWLAEELRSGRIDLVAPTSDVIAFHTATDRVLDCLFKDRFDAACARNGFRTPWAAYPASVEEARERAPTFRYPAVIKPRSHVGVGLERGEVVRDAEELRRTFHPYRLAMPMVQEYIPGALHNLYSVSGILGRRGEPIAVSASRKDGQWPPTLGIGIEFHACDDRGLIALGTALAQKVLGSGIFEVEFIRDARGGDWLAIDLNPRAHGFIRFDIERGHDLPLLWYRMATGETVEPQAPPRGDLVWRHAIPWHVRRWVRRLRGLPVLPAPPRSVDVIHDPADPLPTAPFFAVMLRHPGGLVRPFVRESAADAAVPQEWNLDAAA
jgi:hypothetical protein